MSTSLYGQFQDPFQAERAFRELESLFPNQVHVIQGKTASQIVVQANGLDMDLAEHIIHVNGGDVISEEKASVFDHDDPYVTAEPIQPYTSEFYIDPNLGPVN